MRIFFVFLALALLVVPLVSAADYTDTINRYFLTSDSYVWSPTHEGNFSRIKINGDIEGTGRVRIYLIQGGEQLLVYSRSQQEANLQISDYVELEEGSDMGLVLSYADGSWDTDNDGIESNGGGIDFSIEPVFFTHIDESHLCTAWDIYSVENDQYTTSCYGGSSCCSFLGYESRLDDWDENFVVAHGAQGVTMRNVVLTRLVFFNGTKIGYSNYDALPAVFVESSASGSLANIDSIPTNNPLLRIVLDENTYFNLQSITYSIEEEQNEVSPVQPVVPVATLPVAVQSPSIVSTQNSWSAFFPEIYREQMDIDTSMYIHRAQFRSNQTLYNATLALNKEGGVTFLQVINVEVPPTLTSTFEFKIPIADLGKGNLQVLFWNDSWVPLDAVFLRSDLDHVYYRVDLVGGGKLGLKSVEAEREPLFDITSFWYFGIAIVVACVFLLFFGVRRVLFTELDLAIRSWKFKRDIKNIRKIVKKYGK